MTYERRNQEQIDFYIPDGGVSGKFYPTFLVNVLLLVLITYGLIISGYYESTWTTIFLSVPFTIALAHLTGWLTVKLGHVRNPTFTNKISWVYPIVFTIAKFAVGFYYFENLLVADKSDFADWMQTTFLPERLWSVIALVWEVILYRYFSARSMQRFTQKPYDKLRNKWCKAYRLHPFELLLYREAAVEKIAGGDFTPLVELKRQQDYDMWKVKMEDSKRKKTAIDVYTSADKNIWIDILIGHDRRDFGFKYYDFVKGLKVDYDTNVHLATETGQLADWQAHVQK